jgi:hypothetical protein
MLNVTDMQQEVDSLIEANKAAFSDLARQGVQPDQMSLINMRIDTLAKLVLSEPGFLQFRLRFEQNVAEALEQVRGEVRKAQLAAGAQASPQEVRQMARASGLLGPDGKPLG